MLHSQDRRQFLKQCATASAAGLAWTTLQHSALANTSSLANTPLRADFKISLAEWSLNRMIFGKKLDHLDFAKTAKESFGIEAVEYVNQFFKDKAKDQSYLAEMKKRADDHGVRSLLIMIDEEGALGDPDNAKRKQAIENHYPWVEAAKGLGCHSIRVNAQSTTDFEESSKLATDGLRRLSEFAKDYELNVIVENHGGLSSHGKWLSQTIAATGMKNCGTLPDFGNFYEYDRYQGVTDLMPFAKAVSAKSYDFDAQGNEVKIDFMKMMQIVLAAGYHGYVGIEYEGEHLEEFKGIQATKDLLERCRKELA